MKKVKGYFVAKKRLGTALIGVIILLSSLNGSTVYADPYIHRAEAVSYMKAMAGTVWYSPYTFTNKYSKVTGTTNPNYVKYAAYKSYLGMPYSQHYLTTWYKFTHTNCTYSIASQTYVLNMSTPTDIDRNTGNDCSTAVINCWEYATGYNFTSSYTGNLITNVINGSDKLIRVGGYGVPTGVTDTLKIVNANINMLACYAQLKAGDICVKNGPTPHAIMVTSVGAADITYTDQWGGGIKATGAGTETSPYIAAKSSWHQSSTMLFATLLKEGYIPISTSAYS